MVECNLTVIDASTNDNSFLGDARRNNPGAIDITSLTDMVDKLIAAATNGNCCIKHLKIIGHGWAGGIVVGNGQDSNDPAKRIDLSKSEWEAELTRLKAKLCPGATIELYGCHVGADAAGAKKLQEIADVTGATVTAPTGKVYGDGTKENSPDQTARPGQPAPLPVPAPAEGKTCKDKGKVAPEELQTLQDQPVTSLVVVSGMVEPPSQFGAIPEYLRVTPPSSIHTLLSQIDLTNPRDVRHVGAAINAVLYAFGNGPEPIAGPFIIINEFGLIGVRGDWTGFCPISEAGQAWFRQLAAANLAAAQAGTVTPAPSDTPVPGRS